MSISFACDQCGKTFTVDDKFAGKKGKCKQCGGMMQIPAGAPSRPIPRSIDREVSPSRRAPSPPTPPAEDVYGFEDAPLPPRSSAATLREEDDGGPAVATRPKKKKKAVGLFAGSKKKVAPNGQSAGTIVIRVVVGIVCGIGAFLFSQSGVRNMLTPGWAFRGDIESFIKKQVDGTNELTAVLRDVTDVPSATAASARANAAIKALTKNLTSNKDRKGNQKDIDDIKQKYQFAQQQALTSFTREIARVAMIPGALDALAIEASLQELAAIEASIPGAQNAGGFVPPRMPMNNFTPPPMPQFNPPQPNINPPQPNFNPPQPNFNPPRPGGGMQPGGLPRRNRPRPPFGGPG